MDEADRTQEAVSTPTTGSPCLFCGGPVAAPKRKIEKLFCCDRHRAAYRDQVVQAAIREATAAVEETQGELGRLSARLEGAAALLERVKRKDVHRAALKRTETTGNDLTPKPPQDIVTT